MTKNGGDDMDEQQRQKQWRNQPRYQYLKRAYRLAKPLTYLRPRHGRLVNSINDCRMARHMTQAALARAAGLSRRTVNGIETNQVEPRVGAAMSLARALDVPMEKLFRLD